MRAHADSGSVVINEIQYGDKSSATDEFIELYNPGDTPVVLDKYKLTKKTSTGTESNLVSSAKFSGTIAARGYFVIAPPAYASSIQADLAYSGATYSLADNNTVLLYDNKNNLLDTVGWGSAKDFEGAPASAFDAGQSIGRIDGKDTDDNSKDFFLLDSPSPGKENKKAQEKPPAPPPAPQTYPDGIVINELYPYPNAGEEEFIELYNPTDDDVSLENWSVHDASKTGNYIFPTGATIEKHAYDVVTKTTDFTFALNNSGNESVTLFDPNGKDISSVSYDGSKQGISYSYDGSKWRWTQYVTPGQENKFGNAPYGTLDIDSDIYVNTYADFSVSTGDADGSKVKVTWDFGDGHKSYLAKTRHKYVALGSYQGSVTLSNGIEDVTKDFTADVKNYPHPKIQIIQVNANPKGSDAKLETLMILNKSKKTINLSGWSIATGAKKKLTNHPIKMNVKIKKKKSKTITKDMSKFSLNNKKGKIELRYPDGKVASKLKYDHGKISIADDEVYRKIKGGWAWEGGAKPQTQNVKPEIPIVPAIAQENAVQNVPAPAEPPADETQNDAGTQTEPPAIATPIEIPLPENKFEQAVAKSGGQPQVLGAETVREVGDQYIFTPQSEESHHYAATFFERIFSFFNSSFNLLLNKIF